MSMLVQLVRGRLRVPLMWVLIVFVLGADVAAWAARRDTSTNKSAASATNSGADGVVSPDTAESTSTVAASPGTSTAKVAVGGSPSPTAGSGPVRVAAGPGTVTVSWDAMHTSPSVQSYIVRANEDGTGAHGTLIVCGSCTTATFRGLTNGTRYTFTVTGQTASGSTAAEQSPPAVPGSPLCAGVPACVAVDATTTHGTANNGLNGFLHGIDGYTNKGRVFNLHPTNWRGSAGQWWHQTVAPYGVQTTEVLSDDWRVFAYDKDKGGATAPWDDWDRYETFVKNIVAKAENEGWAPTYWEILNEPEAGLSYTAGSPQTPSNVLDTYLHGYQAIKEADPQAKVIGPSTMATLEAIPGKPTLLDLTTFLDFANAHNMKLDAIAWHETGPDHLGPFDRLPESISNHADRLRNELFRWPNIGKPQLFINEFGTGRALGLPGWRVGYLAAAENAGIDSGDASCWALGDDDPAGCGNFTLGGLLDKDKSTPRTSYWAQEAYSTMRGARLDVSSTVPFLTGFAVDQGKTWQVLLGRHQSCTKAANALCNEPASATPAPVPLTVAIKVGGPDRAITVSVERIPDAVGPMPDQPPASSQQIVVRDGVARFVTPPFADGEAYNLQLG
ncbi:MAG: fibronectin type III domain-containing protein [Acidimicrobiia bacterium]|nr:fibronectin type III domain-containing protein [Acidimicrobiia bacterium]